MGILTATHSTDAHPQMPNKVAIFLDVESLSGWLKSDGGKNLLHHAQTLGDIQLRRAYGDFSQAAVNSRQSALIELGFEFIHVHHPVKGKNAADIQIAVDVMDTANRCPDLNWFVLATGDSDFSPLFRRLKALNKSVVGIGNESVLSCVVQNCCDRFIYTNSNALATNDPYLQAIAILTQAIAQLETPTDLPHLKAEMLKLDPTFDHSRLGFSQFLKFLKSAPTVVKLEQTKNNWVIYSASGKPNIISLNSKTAKTSKKKAV